jgi:hypothetical protein
VVHHNEGFMHEEDIQKYFNRHFPKPTGKQRPVDFREWVEAGHAHKFTYDHHGAIAGKMDTAGNPIFDCDAITDEWYKWFFTTPLSVNPANNPGKLYGDKDVSGGRNVFLFDKRDVLVYFVAASPFQDPDVRSITLTRKAPLLVPIYNVSASLQSYPSKDYKGLADMVKQDLLGVKGETFEAKFDGESLHGCCVVRENPLKITSVPPDNIFGIPEERLRETNWTTETCHGGFWLLMKEEYLTSGEHLLYFNAESKNYQIKSNISIRMMV